MRSAWLSRRIKKVHGMALPPAIKRDLVEQILENTNKIVLLYAWDINQSVASSAYLTETLCLKSWLRVHGKEILEHADHTAFVVIEIPLLEAMKLVKEGVFRNIPVVKENSKTTKITLSEDLLPDLKPLIYQG